MTFDKNLLRDYSWLNRPDANISGEVLTLVTSPGTDFWQRTHYGFRNDNGHFLYTSLNADFAYSVRVNCKPRMQYDQCGLMVRIDEDNWLKVSAEFETENHSRLGSVVTNGGYSDWATQDLSGSAEDIWYRIQRRGRDFLVEHSFDGSDWRQMRICRLINGGGALFVGPYACSPKDSSFQAVFSEFNVESPNWTSPD